MESQKIKICFFGGVHNTINVFICMNSVDEYYTENISALRNFLSQFDVWDGAGCWEKERITISFEFPSTIMHYVKCSHFKSLIYRQCKNVEIEFEYKYFEHLKIKDY